MKKLAVIICFLGFFTGLSAQEEKTATPEGLVKGIVVNSQDDFPLISVNIINLTKVKGTITNEKGEFEISAAVNDTLYFSYIGFKPFKVRVTNDFLKFENNKIVLTELAYALDQVVVKSLRLTGYIEIDAKNIPVNNADRYSISGLARGYEAGRPGNISNIISSFFGPSKKVKNVFSTKTRQLNKLRLVKDDEQIRDLLASKYDRQTLVALVQVDKVDIEDILRECNYSAEFIQTANDLQIMDAINGCYEEFKVLSREN